MKNMSSLLEEIHLKSSLSRRFSTVASFSGSHGIKLVPNYRRAVHIMKLVLIYFLTLVCVSAQVPRDCKQAIVGVTSGWNSSHVTLHIYQKNGSTWQLVGAPWKGRLGKNGLAWGYGLHPSTSSSSPIKKEGDKRAPAGIFKIGGAYGYAQQIKKTPYLKYHKITTKDLWVEDTNSPHYNKHLVIPHTPKTSWEKKAQMRQGDYAHALKLYIAHNDAIMGGKPIPGRGSAIFFHIWRGGGSKSTAGCTTMDKAKLSQMISLIDPNKKPVYILLPQSEYVQLRSSWKLP